MLDEALELRLEIFTGSDEHGPAVVPFVRGELERIDLHADARTDDNLGMFASHLFAALCRSLRDEALTEFSADDVIDAALAERPDALPASQAMAERALAALGAQLPHTEVRILALHFATLLAQHPKENR